MPAPTSQLQLVCAAADDMCCYTQPAVDSVAQPADARDATAHAAYEECPQAEYTGIALEYGTLPPEAMIGALRADQWLENHPQADAATRTAIKRQTRDAFYVDTDAWKERIVEQGRAAAAAAVRGLAASR